MKTVKTSNRQYDSYTRHLYYLATYKSTGRKQGGPGYGNDALKDDMKRLINWQAILQRPL